MTLTPASGDTPAHRPSDVHLHRTNTNLTFCLCRPLVNHLSSVFYSFPDCSTTLFSTRQRKITIRLSSVKNTYPVFYYLSIKCVKITLWLTLLVWDIWVKICVTFLLYLGWLVTASRENSPPLHNWSEVPVLPENTQNRPQIKVVSFQFKQQKICMEFAWTGSPELALSDSHNAPLHRCCLRTPHAASPEAQNTPWEIDLYRRRSVQRPSGCGTGRLTSPILLLLCPRIFELEARKGDIKLFCFTGLRTWWKAAKIWFFL